MWLEALGGASSPDLGKGVGIREGFREELLLPLSLGG